MHIRTLVLGVAVLAFTPALIHADPPKPLAPGEFGKLYKMIPNLGQLPPNTWAELKYTTEQPSADSAEKGSWGPQGWNKIIYDPDGKRVLFYDRWIDKKHGGYTIYGNCLFGFDPTSGVLKPIKIDNWTKMEPKQGGYRTLALAENDTEPTPAPRHVYHCFEHVPELHAVFLCNGANQTVIDKDGKLVGHDACDGAWRFDLKSGKWTKIASTQYPPNMLDAAMAYCPDTKSIVYHAGNRQLWIMDVATGQFRKARQSPPPRSAAGATIVYDSTQRRMLIAGGGMLEGQYNQAKSAGFRELFAFDPKTETVKKLADCPTALYEAHLAYDSKREIFITAAVYAKEGQPSGVFAYDPKKDVWQEIKPAGAIPASGNWFGWVQMCYDSDHDCFIAKVRDRLYAFRYLPGG